MSILDIMLCFIFLFLLSMLLYCFTISTVPRRAVRWQRPFAVFRRRVEVDHEHIV
jgi:hypothetical protein